MLVSGGLQKIVLRSILRRGNSLFDLRSSDWRFALVRIILLLLKWTSACVVESARSSLRSRNSTNTRGLELLLNLLDSVPFRPQLEMSPTDRLPVSVSLESILEQ